MGNPDFVIYPQNSFITLAPELECYLVDEGADGSAGSAPGPGHDPGPSKQSGDGLVEGHHDRPGGDSVGNGEVQLPVLPGVPRGLESSDGIASCCRGLPDRHGGGDEDDGDGQHLDGSVSEDEMLICVEVEAPFYSSRGSGDESGRLTFDRKTLSRQ